MCVTFDHTKTFQKSVDKNITNLRIMGKYLNIPFLVSFAVENDKNTTKYLSYVNTTVMRVGMLSRDVVPDCINVMFNGFHPVKLDTMDKDVENHREPGDAMPDSWKDINKKRVFNSRKDFREQLLPLVLEIVEYCKKFNIPFFMVFAVADDGNDTVYEWFEPDWETPPLTKNIFMDAKKIVIDGCISSIDDIMEDDLLSSGTGEEAERAIAFTGEEEGKKPAGTARETKAAGKKEIPPSWRTYKKGE